jgi:hypothetical protein
MGSGQIAQIFSWDVYPRTALSSIPCGVSESRAHAIGGLVEALQGTPEGTRGVIKTATVDSLGDVSYTYGSVVIEAHRDATNCVTVWVR